MTSWRAGELDGLSLSFPGAYLVDVPDGTTLVSIPSIALPAGWSLSTTPVWFILPIGYPAAQPDCFWASSELRLVSGAMPSNSGVQQLPAIQESALWFSWHLVNWRPALDNVSTYIRFVLRRFADAR